MGRRKKEKEKEAGDQADFFRVHQPGTRLGTALTLSGCAFGGLAQLHTNWVSGLVVMKEDENKPTNVREDRREQRASVRSKETAGLLVSSIWLFFTFLPFKHYFHSVGHVSVSCLILVQYVFSFRFRSFRILDGFSGSRSSFLLDLSV